MFCNYFLCWISAYTASSLLHFLRQDGGACLLTFRYLGCSQENCQDHANYQFHTLTDPTWTPSPDPRAWTHRGCQGVLWTSWMSLISCAWRTTLLGGPAPSVLSEQRKEVENVMHKYQNVILTLMSLSAIQSSMWCHRSLIIFSILILLPSPWKRFSICDWKVPDKSGK